MNNQQVSRSTVAEKLPYENQHFEALERMRALDAYYQWSLALLKPWIGDRVMDAGCGIGNGTAILARSAKYVLAADLSPLNVTELIGRFNSTLNVEPLQVDLDSDFTYLADRKLDTIVCMDVLEHIEDDRQLIRRFYDVIQPGGHLLIKVPAMMWLFGSVDEASGHYRRYSRSELTRKVQDAGWKVVHSRYMNIFGVAPYFWKSRVRRKATNLSRTFAPWQLRYIARLIPLLQRVDQAIAIPCGQSFILAAQRDN